MKHEQLPDLFETPRGNRITSTEEWDPLRLTWLDRTTNILFGGLPPAPDRLRIEPLCHARLADWDGAPAFDTYRVHVEYNDARFGFVVQLVVPEGIQPRPVIVNGDGCWRYLTDEVIQRFVEQGYIVAQFNRTEIAADPSELDSVQVTSGQGQDRGGVYAFYPDATFGVIAAWAWGYHRVVDLLEQLSSVDTSRIAVTGHSRGGKSALLAGATDVRVAVVNDNAGGTAGAAAFRYAGEGSESLERIVTCFPGWFGPEIRKYIDREPELPFDQHALLAAVAPRALLLTYATGDPWSNPEGMIQSAKAARTVYDFLGTRDRIAFHLREGAHRHGVEDFDALLDFLSHVWEKKRLPSRFNSHPYELKPAFDWRTP